MHTIREINFQTEPFCFTGDRRAVDFPCYLVHGCGTKILAGISVLFHASRNANICIEHMQMTWLIFFVTRARVIHVRQPVKRKFTVAFEPFLGILRTLCSSNFFVVLVPPSSRLRIAKAGTALNFCNGLGVESRNLAMLNGLMQVRSLPHLIAMVMWSW